MRHTKTKNQSISHVRIIAGEYRRRNISFIDADGLRPTPDRVRETIFNWLNSDLVQATVLDICAGSGAFGFESLSRGAASVVMIEPNNAQYQQLQQTQQALNIPSTKLTMYCDKAEKVLPILNQRFKQPFDVVFIDPPYGLNLWQDLLKLLIEQGLIGANSLIYIEANQEHSVILGDYLPKFTEIKYKKMGGIFAGVYQLH